MASANKIELVEKKDALKQENRETGVDTDDEPIEIYHRDRPELIKSLLGAAAGNFLEWFDFTIFGLLATEIGENFFPKTNETLALIESLCVFAAAFLMRPIGGALFGYIGDRVSRLFALRLSIFMMAIPTFLTGCLPTYNTIGVTATILLVIFRLIQGLSVGGELTGALVYVSEVCPQNRRSLFAALVQASGCGAVLGALVEALLRIAFTQEQITAWAWRLPFLMGVVVALCAVWIRRSLHESDEFENKKAHGETHRNPVFDFLRSDCLTMFIIVCHLSLPATSYYILFIWMPTYLLNYREPFSGAYMLTMSGNILAIFLSLFSAYLGDIFTPSKIIIIFGVIYVVCIPLLVPMLEIANDVGTVVVYICITVMWGMYSGNTSIWAIDLLTDTVLRYSGLGLSYNMALAIFGGTAPLLATIIVSKYGLLEYTWLFFSIGFVSVTSVILTTFCKSRFADKNHPKYEEQKNLEVSF